MKHLVFFSAIFHLAMLFSSDIFSQPSDKKELQEVITKNIIEENFNNNINTIYKSCKLSGYGLDKGLFHKGYLGFYNIKNKQNGVKDILTIIDYDKPSTEKRLWIIDLKNQKVLMHTLVAHGKNSGENLSVNFSNTPNSNMSSLGFYLTGDTYEGKHGLSLVIDGLDKNTNCNAKSRCIVIHGAEYVSENFIKCTGRLGRSQGCPAVPVDQSKEIINLIKDRTVLFISKSSTNFKSEWLNEKLAYQALCK